MSDIQNGIWKTLAGIIFAILQAVMLFLLSNIYGNQSTTNAKLDALISNNSAAHSQLWQRIGYIEGKTAAELNR